MTAGVKAVEETAKPAAEKAADMEFVKTLAEEMAKAQGIALADAMAHVKGVVTRRPKRPEEWRRKPLPDRCEPGECVITDDGGNNPKVAPVYLVAKDSRGTQVNEMEGIGDARSPGSLWSQVEAKQLIVAHYTPVPNRTPDGRPVMVRGVLRYPHETLSGVVYDTIKDGPEPWATSYYHPVYGRDYYKRAMAARKG
jgi:hypothetical protein